MRIPSGPSRRSLLIGATLALPAKHLRASETMGIHADRIVFGQVAALSGPLAMIGQGMRDGIFAAFAEANEAGGVGGRRLELQTRDDGYEPDRSIRGTADLIGQGIFALIGAVGTPTALAAQVLAAARGVPFIAPMSGAAGLRSPELRHVINLRPSYAQETEVIVDRLSRDLGFDRVGILYQDDAFGRSGLAGMRLALSRRGAQPVEQFGFPRNTVAIKTAMLELREAGPQVVVSVAPYEPCAAFIGLARKYGFNPFFAHLSAVGAHALADRLGPLGAGVHVTQTVPDPAATAFPVAEACKRWLARVSPARKVDHVVLEGFLAARATLAALRPLGREPRRTALLEALRSGPFDLGGFAFSLAGGRVQGSDAVFLSMIDRTGTVVGVDRFSVV